MKPNSVVFILLSLESQASAEPDAIRSPARPQTHRFQLLLRSIARVPLSDVFKRMRAPQHIAADLQLCDNSPFSASGSRAGAYAAANAENVTAITKYALLRSAWPRADFQTDWSPRGSLRGPSSPGDPERNGRANPCPHPGLVRSPQTPRLPSGS